jgi:type IV secretion system protein VirB10
MQKPDANSHSHSSGTQQAAETPVAVKSAAPEGVMRPNAKLYAFLGIALVILMATTISSVRRPQEKPKAANATVLPQEQDTNRISDFGNVVKREIAEQQKAADKTAFAAPQPQNTLGAPGQNSGTMEPSGYGTGNAGGNNQNPEDQQREALAAQERELAFKSRFASNLAYSASRAVAQPTPAPSQQAYVYQASTSGPQQTAPSLSGAQKQRPAEVAINSAVGQPYVLYEGTIIDTVLMNRLDGDESGPVKVLVTDPVYSHDRQHILIPEGSVILGESRKIGEAGFGQQRRMALVFHRLLMPDGYSVDLDRFAGLNQVGEGGIKDKVNNHYLQIFGTSIALGIVGGAAELSAGNAGVVASGTDALKSAVGASVSQSATNILDKFLNVPPTITIREGHRIKVYLSQDLLLPAIENHTIPPNI